MPQEQVTKLLVTISSIHLSSTHSWFESNTDRMFFGQQHIDIDFYLSAIQDST